MVRAAKLLLLLSLLLSLLLGELESVHLGGHAAHVVTTRVPTELLRLEQAHIDVLLVCSSNLLLLLLKQFDLLLNSQLFHYKREKRVGSVQGFTARRFVEHTHQRGQLRGTSPMSDVKLAAIGARSPGLAALLLLLIHDPS